MKNLKTIFSNITAFALFLSLISCGDLTGVGNLEVTGQHLVYNEPVECGHWTDNGQDTHLLFKVVTSQGTVVYIKNNNQASDIRVAIAQSRAQRKAAILTFSSEPLWYRINGAASIQGYPNVFAGAVSY